MPRDSQRWGSNSELEFIKRLGSHRPLDEISPDSILPKKELIRRYIASSSNRSNWDDINDDWVVKSAREYLNRLEAVDEKDNGPNNRQDDTGLGTRVSDEENTKVDEGGLSSPQNSGVGNYESAEESCGEVYIDNR